MYASFINEVPGLAQHGLDFDLVLIVSDLWSQSMHCKSDAPKRSHSVYFDSTEEATSKVLIKIIKIKTF